MSIDVASKISFTWRIFFTDKSSTDEHISTVGKDLHISYVLSRSYCVVFNNQTHERKYLSLIKDDPSVTAVYPERERQGIFYDEDEESHPEPYTADEIVIFEVRVCF